MEELRKLVKKLEQEYGDKKQIEILQEIGKKLINEYEIQIGKFTIEPLLVEAYYNTKNEKKFLDCSVHATGSETANTAKLARERQENNFGELYVHYGTNDGIDLILSDGDYYLSFLIKNSLINGKVEMQSAVSKTLCRDCDGSEACNGGFKCKYYGEKILKKVENRKKEVVCIPRRRTKGYYSQAPLAMLAVDTFKDKEQAEVVRKSLELNFQKQCVLAKYALDKGMANDSICEFVKERGLYKDKISDEYIEEAEKYKEFLITNGWK